MTIEDFNEEEFQIIASSDQLFEDSPFTRVIINDLDFGFECNECRRFSTRTASEKERVESIEHQPWCKTAFFPALMALLGMGGEAAGAAAAGTAAATEGAVAAGTAAGSTAATIAPEAVAAGTGAAGAAGMGAAEAAEGIGATTLTGGGEAASPGLMSKATDFLNNPATQQGLQQYNNSQAQKQNEEEQRKYEQELIRQTASETANAMAHQSSKWGKIIVARDRDSEQANIPIGGPMAEEDLGSLLSKTRYSTEPLEGAHETEEDELDGGHVEIRCKEPNCPVPTNGIFDDGQKSEGNLYRKLHHLGPEVYHQLVDKSRRQMWEHINKQRANRGDKPFGSASP